MNRLRNILACLCPVLLLAAGHARAAIAVWSDNFEGNAASRWYSTSPWKIGSPTAGPVTNALGYRTYSGTNCASTQGYSPAGQDAWLVCTNYGGTNTTLLVPPSGLSPRLRFQQWFSFANATAYVEVSTNSGANWTSLSLTNGGIYSYSGGNVWSRPSIDLSAYGGQNIQIAFLLTIGGTGNGLGWFVDDVEVDEGPPVLNFPESFEAGEGDWSVDSGGWEIGKPTGGPGAAHTGTNCAATKLSGNYANLVDSRLISPPFLVPSSGSPQLRFWQWYNLNYASGWVEINNGAVNNTTTTNVTITTNTVSMLDANVYQFPGLALAGYNSPFYYNSTIGAWTNATKVFGTVFDQSFQPYGTYFEAGNPPFTNYLSLGSNPNDYRANLASLTPVTNLQGVTWIPESGGASIVGNFNTTNSVTYTTNTGTVFSQSSWITISPTNGFANGSSSSAGWTNISLDLSSYEGEVVEIAFHFASGGISTAPGWFVDDILVTSPPQLTALTNVTIFAGQTFTEEFTATNPLLPNATYTFSSPSFPGLQITNNGPTEAVLTWTNTGIVNGVLNWTNFGIAPGTYTFSVIAADNSSPSLTATNSFQLTIQPPLSPTIAGLSSQTFFAGQTFTDAINATNSSVPNATYSFSMLSAFPAVLLTNAGSTGAVLTWTNLGIVNGVLHWTNNGVAPSTNTLTVFVTDKSEPPLTYTTNFQVVIQPPPPPTLTVPPTQSIKANQTLTATISATNNIVPNAQYTYQLVSAPVNAVINSNNGVITWPTTSSQPAGQYMFSVKATDNSVPALSTATNSFAVMVGNAETPILIVPPDQTNYAGQTLVVTNYATNNILPGKTFSFSLLSPLQTNMDVSQLASKGILKWPIPINQAPGIYTNVIQATDNSSPYASVSSNFLVVVLSPPDPILNLPPEQDIYGGARLDITSISATNFVFTNSIYTFTVTNSPAGVTINGSTGELTWQTTAATNGNNYYAISVVVADNHTPPLTTNGTFTVGIFPTPAPSLSGAVVHLSGGRVVFTVDTPVTDAAWQILATTNLNTQPLIWVPVYTNTTTSLMFTDLLATNYLQRFFRVVIP